jgi:hypothetical protein
MNSDEMVKSLLGLFQEAYEGTNSSFFSDSDKGGLFKTVENLRAEQASRPVVADGLSVAAHAEHLRWSLANLNAAASGSVWNPNWSESWRVRQVDSAAWDMLRSALRHEYETTRETLQHLDATRLEPMMFTGAVASIAHAAYHLGAIRATLNALPRT